jgi:hypothetical protein
MTLQTDLLAIERRFWTGDREFYQRHVDDQCLTAFTSRAGVAPRERIAATVGEGPRWRDVKIDLKGVVAPTADVAILTYQASATRADGERYAALVSSAYVNRDGTWKLAFHQQTPLHADQTERADRWPRDPLDVDASPRKSLA